MRHDAGMRGVIDGDAGLREKQAMSQFSYSFALPAVRAGERRGPARYTVSAELPWTLGNNGLGIPRKNAVRRHSRHARALRRAKGGWAYLSLAARPHAGAPCAVWRADRHDPSWCSNGRPGNDLRRGDRFWRVHNNHAPVSDGAPAAWKPHHFMACFSRYNVGYGRSGEQRGG
jgi:hypothetical protein